MGADDSQPVRIVNEGGAGDVVLLCEHASNHIPERFAGLGLTDAERVSHIAWDPGAAAVTERLSVTLDAPAVLSGISRLVYDCNRPPDSPGAMPARSETTDIPGNRELTEEERAQRVALAYTPFCEAVRQLLDARKAQGRPTVLVTIHSFTPVYFGKPREVELGILHDNDTRLADAMLERAGTLPHRAIRRNDPYGPEDGVTHSLRLHGIARDLPNVMIELRNDLIADTAGQAKLSDELLGLLNPAIARLTGSEVSRA